ncbi:N-formylglutamate deformylase [Pseudooceanicola aestuarii]|uniref:N-formylglutamate deformylase n=1 Tax=Pseudooceanicola aestuarii TaxID=2697319 RepID=UPI0013D2BAC4|nr:N-formylglutamate deformylase [Pseudooceanicola aestuarii]
MPAVDVTEGDSPLVLGMPHTGTHIPDEIANTLNDEGQVLRDTDWHIDTLYAGLAPGASVVRATFHRYVIDANRDPSGQTLYPGQTTTGLVPLTTFDNVPIWREGAAPDAAEIARRVARYHAPYHVALRAQLDRVRARHGFAILFDCHSIRSVIPWLFDGILPDLNIGTDMGRTCAPAIEAAARAAAKATGRRHVVNGRFRGGWTTRHYGRPNKGLHALQLELAQATHLRTEQPPFALDPAKTATLRPQLAHLLSQIQRAAPAAGSPSKGLWT